MISIVTIVHNQEANLKRILAAWDAQTMFPDLFVFVCDRCTDESETMLRQSVLPAHMVILSVDTGIGFQAGHARELGLAEARKLLHETSVVFVDGDCIPSPHFIEHHSSVLDNDFPVVCCGTRHNEIAQRITSDPRLGFTGNKMFVARQDTVVMDGSWISRQLTCWSCNVGVNSRAIETLQVLFDPVFDGSYGYEDTWLGMNAFMHNVIVVAMDPLFSYVVHIEHPTTHVDTNTNRGKYNELVASTSKQLPYTVVVSRQQELSNLLMDFYENVLDVQSNEFIDSVFDSSGLPGIYKDMARLRWARNLKLVAGTGDSLFNTATIRQALNSVRSTKLALTNIQQQVNKLTCGESNVNFQ